MEKWAGFDSLLVLYFLGSHTYELTAAAYIPKSLEA